MGTHRPYLLGSPTAETDRRRRLLIQQHPPGEMAHRVLVRDRSGSGRRAREHWHVSAGAASGYLPCQANRSGRRSPSRRRRHQPQPDLRRISDIRGVCASASCCREKKQQHCLRDNGNAQLSNTIPSRLAHEPAVHERKDCRRGMAPRRRLVDDCRICIDEAIPDRQPAGRGFRDTIERCPSG